MNEQLMAAILFTPEDLAANRQGRLTADQNLRLEKEFSSSEGFGRTLAYCFWAVAALLIIVMLGIGLPEALTASIAKTRAKQGPDTMRWAVLALSCIALAAAGLSSLFVLVAKKGRKNLGDGLPVFAVTGTVAKSEFETWYTLKVADREFVYSYPNDSVYKAFETGRSYCVYYIFNTSYIIVSAESSE